jgi:hypothetical protein
VSAFADAEIIKLANESYIAVAADDWYQRRREDAEGEFFRKVADQGPRKGQGGSTRQGIYCFTADGTLLAYKNAGQDANVMREVFRQGLTVWNKLPAERRKPGAVSVGEPGKDDQRFARTPPPGGLIATVYTRIIDRDPKQGFSKGTCEVLGGDRAARDHLWLTVAEMKSLVPANPKTGESTVLPNGIAERILRFHLFDNTRGEPPSWSREEIRNKELTLTVESASADQVRLRLTGTALLANNADTAKATRGFDVRFFGELHWNRKAEKFDRFDIVAAGDHWGEATFTRNARPGRQPLGVAIELAGDKPADRVPPQAAREVGAYFGRY